jgi:hypothetical protein
LLDVRKRSLEIVSVDDFDHADLQAGLTPTGDAARGQQRKAA